MYGFASVSFASFALLSSVQGLPFNPTDFDFYGHADPARSQSAQTTTSSLKVNQNDVAPGQANPQGYLTGSGSLTLATASGYARPTGTGSGYVWPNGNGTGYAYPTGTGFPTYPTAVSSAHPTINATATNSYNSTSTSVPSAPSNGSANSALPEVLRGVNIGGWLVLEKWMNSSFFDDTDAVDQWTFDSSDNAEAKLQAHWSSYFTESDVAQLASWGINAMRIPIGYWAYDNSNTPYISGADAYLEKAIGWCRTHGLKVLVDCHGSPGSQNGFDNSGRSGSAGWQVGDNMQRSIGILETMAKKYGATEYADVVFGIEMVNEPISWGANDIDTTKRWAKDAYNAIKGAATNPNLNVIMHDAFEGPSAWQEISDTINGGSSLADSKFWIDTHLYQNQVAADSWLTQDQHIEKACNWTSSELLPPSSNLPVIVGEFSAGTNICANPDGSTVAGSACYIDGCQCSSNVPIEQWNEPLITATRKFLEAELDAFEGAARGWFMWSYQGPGAWGYANAVQYGLIGESVTDRMFPGQCKSS